MLIFGLSETVYVNTSYRIVIEHINHNPGKDSPDRLNEEFVVLANDGVEKVSLAGWSLTDETATGARRHVYAFPQNVSLSPRDKVFIHTGPGQDVFEQGKPSVWKLHWGRHAFVWNNEGDTATLFDLKGNKVDSLQVVTVKAT